MALLAATKPNLFIKSTVRATFMKHSSKSEVFIAALVVALGVSAAPKSANFFKGESVLAQSTAPNAAPESNSELRIESSSSMAVTTQNSVQRLKQQSPNTQVSIDYQDANTALQSVRDGKADLAAVGRPLAAPEKTDLSVTPQGRKKIAIVVGADNPFRGNLTFEQFAKIFRGEITDWSEVGGQPGPIRLVDRPDSNDTRQALQNYAVFQQAPFQAAPGAIKVAQDDTDAVVKELGTQGISYAIADQVSDKPGVRIVPMHKTLPSDPRYPFSQPLYYVSSATPSPAVAAFLGNPTAPLAAPAAPAAPAPAPAQSPAPASAQTADYSWLPWLLLLPLLLGAGLLWWLLKHRSAPAAPPVVTPAPVPIVPPAAPPVPAAPIVAAADEPTLKLYEERLVADTTRQKVGDVSIKKHIETEQAQVSIPLETDRVIIERSVPDANTIATDAAFQEGKIARIETYAEVPDIQKETFIREEVNVRKEIEHDIVNSEATVRKEELDVNAEGAVEIDRDRQRLT